MTLFRRDVAPAIPKTLTFTLQRLDAFGTALPGDLYAEGQHKMVTLENAAKAIPAGRYQVILTVSGRAQRGTLWCPAKETHPDDPSQWVLPLLLDVKDRDAIRVHSLNDADESEGCIGVGFKRDGASIRQSRVALIAFVAMVRAAIALGEDVWLEVVDA